MVLLISWSNLGLLLFLNLGAWLKGFWIVIGSPETTADSYVPPCHRGVDDYLFSPSSQVFMDLNRQIIGLVDLWQIYGFVSADYCCKTAFLCSSPSHLQFWQYLGSRVFFWLWFTMWNKILWILAFSLWLQGNVSILLNKSLQHSVVNVHYFTLSVVCVLVIF